VKKRRQRDAKIELIINEELRKRQKTVQNSTFQTETPANRKKQAEELKKTATTRSTN